MNPLQDLHALGQSIWLDDIRRDWLRNGTLSGLIAKDGLAGVTSNPAIFAKAINEGSDYKSVIESLAREGRKADAIYENLVLDDVRAAADLFKDTYANTGGQDGFVSLEVSPHLADDTNGTIEEGRRLWRAFNKPNAMIKVPGTAAGLPAIRTLISEGVNINVTLLFGLKRYAEVVDAWLSGLEDRVKNGGSIVNVASVASFFLSRIDTLVDPKLDALGTPEAKALRGRAAISSARLAYEMFEKWARSDRWKALVAQGAKPQRLLWASTSSKDPAFGDTYYVEALIAPQTVNTLPKGTIDAYRDHGKPAVRIREDLRGAQRTVDDLRSLGIDLQTESQQLEREGVRKFIEPFDALMSSLEKAAAKAAA